MISVWSCLREGVDVLVRRLPLLLGAWLVILAVQQAIDLVAPAGGPWAWLNLVFSLVLLSPLYAGQYVLVLQVVRHEPPRFRDLFRGFSRWGTIAVMSILTVLAVAGGFVLFVIPGIVFALMFAWAPIVALDPARSGPNRRPGAIEAMRRSKELTSGYRGTLFGISLLLSIPTIVLMFLVGLSATSSTPAIPPWAIEVFALLSGTLFLGPLHAACYMVAYEAVSRLGRVE